MKYCEIKSSLHNLPVTESDWRPADHAPKNHVVPPSSTLEDSQPKMDHRRPMKSRKTIQVRVLSQGVFLSRADFTRPPKRSALLVLQQKSSTVGQHKYSLQAQVARANTMTHLMTILLRKLKSKRAASRCKSNPPPHPMPEPTSPTAPLTALRRSWCGPCSAAPWSHAR